MPTAHPPSTIRAASLSGFEDLVTSLGGDPLPILLACGLQPSDLLNPEHYLPFAKAAAAVEMAARTLSVTDFGMRLCVAQGLSTLGLLGLMMQSATTLRDALLLGAKYVDFHTPALSYRIFANEEQGLDCAEVFLRQPSPTYWPQTMENTVAHSCRLIHLLTEGAQRPAAVYFRHGPIGTPAQYQQHLGLQPHFQSAFNGFAIRPLDWRQPLPSHNKLLHDFTQRFFQAQPAGTLSTADEVRRVLDTLVRNGLCNLDTVARALHLHPRTLQRRLHTEAVRFEDLQDAARKSWAQQLLSQPDMRLDHIAQLLGFADQSVLTRACQRWWSSTPRRLRAAPQGFAQEP